MGVSSSVRWAMLAAVAGALPLAAQFTITTASLPPASVGTPYTPPQLTATGGTAPIRWTALTLLPNGISLNLDGTFSGSPTTQVGSPFSVTIQAQDSSATPQVTTKPFSLVVNPPIITTTSPLSTAGLNSPYTFALLAAGGAPPYSNWQMTGGPPGLTISSAGVIGGTPTSNAGSPYMLNVLAQDSAGTLFSKQLVLVVNPPQITPATLPSATVGSAYSQTISAEGGAGPPYTNFNLSSGTLPPGITFNTGTRTLGGTPTTQTGSPFSFTIQAQDNVGSTATRTYSLPVYPVLITTNSPLPSGTVGVPYSQPLAAVGGAGGFTAWTLVAPLPVGLEWLQLNPATGALSGTPTTATGSPFSFQVNVRDAANQGVTKTLSLPINPAGLNITTNTLPAAAVNTAYSTTLAATGGTGTYTWSLAAGSTLPSPLTLSTAGVLSGTPTSSVGSPFQFTVQVSDGSTSTPKALTLVVNPPVITTASPLPSGAVNTAYSQTLAAAGGAGAPYSYQLATGSTLPPGLMLSSTGAVGGTPNASGAFNFTVEVRDAAGTVGSKAFSITINPAAALAISSVSPLPPASVNNAYSFTFAATGGTGTLAWTLLSGPTTIGLSLSSAGVLSGTPTISVGSPFTLTVQVTDQSVPTPQVASKQFTLVVNPPVIMTPGSPLPAGTLNAPYGPVVMTAGGGTGPYTYGLATGSSLPPGMTLSSGGSLGGTPTATGTFNFTVQLTDSASQSGTKQFSITISAVNTLAISTATPLPPGRVEQVYTPVTFAATGGTAPYTSWQVVAGTLPTGLQLNASTGVLSGTPASTVQGVHTFTVQVTDSATPTPNTASKQFTLTIDPPALTITTPATLPSGTAGADYPPVTLAASGGTAPYGPWSLITAPSTFPPGLTLSSTGVISGRPTTSVGSPFVFTIQVADNAGQLATRQFTLAIASPSLNVRTAGPLAPAAVGSVYQAAFEAEGGTAPYNWMVTTTLPPGLQAAASQGALLISGTPTSQIGSPFPLTVQVRDSSTPQQTATRSYALVVNPPILVTASPLASATTGAPYNAAIQAAGGTAPYSGWQVIQGQLPPGLILNAATGEIGGTPNTPGSYAFTIRATDAASQTAAKEFTLTVASGLTISTPTLPNGVVLTNYSATLAAAGAVGSITWSVSSGPLPPGLSLFPALGAISGTPTTAGDYTFTLRVADSIQSATRQFTVRIFPQLVITTATLPAGSVGTPYSQAVTATGGSGGEYLWSATGLPPGLTINPSTGLLSGTPTTAGNYTAVIHVRDTLGATASQQFAIPVSGNLSVTTGSLPGGNPGQSYSATLQAAGGTPPYRWQLVSGSLPQGLTLSQGGTIGGTPSATGSFSFVVQAADSATPAATAQRGLTIIIGGQLTIVTPSLPAAIEGQNYSQIVSASGGTGLGYAWSVVSGALPAGLSLNAASGQITGIPTGGGSTFTLQVVDSAGNLATRQFTLSVAAPLAVGTTSLPNGSVGASYSVFLSAAGGTSPYTWSVTGTLPPGLTVLAGSGLISGTPTQAGNYTFAVEVRDSAGLTASRQLSIIVAAPGGALTITTSTLPGATLGSAYSATVQAAGGSNQGYVWALAAGNLPTGMQFTTGGVLAGTPTVAGTFDFTVRVTDSTGGTATRALRLVVSSASAPTITTAALSNATVGQNYSATLQATGGSGSGYTWTVRSGALAPGLVLASSGAISGTPIAAGTATFTVRVTDSAGGFAEREFTLVVTASSTALAIATATLPNGALSQSYSAQLQATGGAGGYQWSVTSGSLPPGITLSAGGALSGTPTQTGSYGFTVRVTDGAAATVERALSINVLAASTLTITTATLPGAALGQPYSASVSGSGGTGQGYQWTALGILPPGITLSAAGTLSGTPTQAGSYQFTVRLTDSAGSTASRDFTLVVNTTSGGVLAITTAALETAMVGRSYSQQIAATGGTGTLTFSVAPGSTLPQGFSLSSSGLLSGMPAASGSFSLIVRVTDATGVPVSKGFTLEVLPALSIVTATLPSGSVSVAYPNQTLSATGGATPYTWSVVGLVPPGLTLAPSGLLSGTPTQAGTYNITLTVTDSRQFTASRGFQIVISSTGLTITTQTLANGQTGAAYNAQIAAVGGNPPYTWTVTGGVLPTGVTFNSSTAILSGTPTQAGTFGFVVQVVDSQQARTERAFSLTVSPSFTIATAVLAGGTLGVAYNQPLAASGGSGTITWSVTTGSLPAGLTLAPATGVISGTPTTTGTATFTVQAADTTGAVATRQYTLTVAAALTISTSSLANGVVGQPYTGALSAAGGAAPLNWAIASGSLPGGLSLSGAGSIAGTPTQAGTFSFSVRVTDGAGAIATRNLTLTITEGLAIATPATLPTASVGVAYSQTLAATGGAQPLTWTITVGSLPAGLTFTPAGVISGTPTTSGVYSFIVQVADAGGLSVTSAFTLTVSAGLVINTPATLPAATVRAQYSETLSASGGAPPYTWSVAAGTLPAGVTVTQDGVLRGTPTAAGTFGFTLRVADSAGAGATRTFTLTVGQGIAIVGAGSLPAAVAGTAYAQSFVASGGAPPYTWTLAEGQIPPGLTLASSGSLTGAPARAGTFDFTLTVTDSAGATASAVFRIAVTLPSLPALSVTGLSDAVEPLRQPTVGVALAGVYPVEVTGRITLAFTPDMSGPADDPAIRFSNGGRTAAFSIPPNTATAVFTGGPLLLQTGTVAGTIRLTVSNLEAGGQALTPEPAPAMTGRVARAAPVITEVRASRPSANVLQVEVTGYATPREVTRALFRFTPAPGSALQTTELTVELADGARRWYESEDSRPFGSLFRLVQQFNVQGGAASAIGSVTVTLTNGTGTSQAATAQF